MISAINNSGTVMVPHWLGARNSMISRIRKILSSRWVAGVGAIATTVISMYIYDYLSRPTLNDVLTVESDFLQDSPVFWKYDQALQRVVFQTTHHYRFINSGDDPLHLSVSGFNCGLLNVRPYVFLSGIPYLERLEMETKNDYERKFEKLYVPANAVSEQSVMYYVEFANMEARFSYTTPPQGSGRSYAKFLEKFVGDRGIFGEIPCVLLIDEDGSEREFHFSKYQLFAGLAYLDPILGFSGNIAKEDTLSKIIARTQYGIEQLRRLCSEDTMMESQSALDTWCLGGGPLPEVISIDSLSPEGRDLLLEWSQPIE